MPKENKFSHIIERIEYLRNLLGLNKSRFSGDIGMKPQTYNNFIGAQGSKPNVELIFGIVNRFGANPMWLLNGEGPVFNDESKSAQYLERSPAYRAEFGAVHEPRSSFQAAPSKEATEALRTELRSIEPVLRQSETGLRQAESARFNVLDRSLALVRRYYEVDPANTLAELREMLQRTGKHLETRSKEK